MRSIWQTVVVGPVVGLVVATAAGAGAQPARQPASRDGWNDSVTRALVDRAIARRQAQLADTALRDYRALARGFLTFLGQVGEGMSEPPRVIQATQVATEVYWHAPNLSKQRVVGTRDTTVLPTDNDFYRDRYQIVQNNFPDVIRLGEGRDVADVPHPLSPGGRAAYDFAIRDSLRIRSAGRTLSVLEVQVRPRDPATPRLVGALFLDRDDAQVVRMAFTFTHAAYLDKRNEDVSIVLENALVQGRFWLPRRQEIEVRRAGTWMDFPARGIIRGRWEIADYAVNTGLPLATFGGPELTFLPPAQRRRFDFGGGTVLDSLPADVRMVTDEDVRRVQAQARALVQQQVLARTRSSALAARRISDFARVNRVEGLALGAGYVARLGSGVSLTAQARFGVDDEAGKGRLALARQWASGAAVRLAGYHDFREAGDEPEGSLARNSLAAQEFGSDYTDPYLAEGLAVGVDLPARGGLRPTIELAWERQDRLAVHATPFSGRYEPTLPAKPLRAVRLALDVERPTAPGPFGTQLRVAAQARLVGWNDRPGDTQLGFCGFVVGSAGCGRTARVAGALAVERAFAPGRLVTHTTIGVVDAGRHRGQAIGVPSSGGDSSAASTELAVSEPIQDLIHLGGPTTGPGYRFHEFAGGFAASQRVEWRAPVPFPSISLGRYGRSPAMATLAPYAHTVYVARRVSRYGEEPRAGWFPAVGVGAYTFFDLVRFDVARGLRDGRWTFSVDVTREFWRVL